jgi:hypothetical protein
LIQEALGHEDLGTTTIDARVSSKKTRADIAATWRIPMKDKTGSPRGDRVLYATLADVKLVLSAPMDIKTKCRGYSKAQAAFVSARMTFMNRATATTWTGTVEAVRRLHAEAKRAEREREATASRAATDEGGEA